MNQRTGQPFRVRMELVPQREHPSGDPRRSYELVIPLDRDGHIDATSWCDDPALCNVRRIRPGQSDARGVLARTPSGRWYFDYGSTQDGAGYQGIRLGDEIFHPGAFIAVNEEDGGSRTFRVTAIEPVEATHDREPAKQGRNG